MIRRPPRSTLFPYTTLFRSHEKPPAHARLHAVHLVAGRGVRDLVEQALRVAPRDAEELGVLLDRAPEMVGAHLQRLSGYLADRLDRKSTRLNSSHANISYAV